METIEKIGLYSFKKESHCCQKIQLLKQYFEENISQYLIVVENTFSVTARWDLIFNLTQYISDTQCSHQEAWFFTGKLAGIITASYGIPI